MSECQRCGKCCISATFNYGKCDKDDIAGHIKLKDMGRWLAYHGCDVGATEHGNIVKYFVAIPVVCKYLGVDDKTKKYYCADYDNRPDVCKRYSCEKQTIITGDL